MVAAAAFLQLGGGCGFAATAAAVFSVPQQHKGSKQRAMATAVRCWQRQCGGGIGRGQRQQGISATTAGSAAVALAARGQQRQHGNSGGSALAAVAVAVSAAAA